MSSDRNCEWWRGSEKKDGEHFELKRNVASGYVIYDPASQEQTTVVINLISPIYRQWFQLRASIHVRIYYFWGRIIAGKKEKKIT